MNHEYGSEAPATGQLHQPPSYDAYQHIPSPGLGMPDPEHMTWTNWTYPQPHPAMQNVNTIDTLGSFQHQGFRQGEMNYYPSPQAAAQMGQVNPPAYSAMYSNPPYRLTETIDYQGQPPWRSMNGPQTSQNVVVINAYGQNIVEHQQTFSGVLVYSCCVMWLWNCPLGFVAFVLATMAVSRAVYDPPGARRYARASLVVSNVGIALTIVIIIIVVNVALNSRRSQYGSVSSSSSSCKYYYSKC